MSDQPMPTAGKTSVTEPFRARFIDEGAERDLLGLERYGTALRTHNGRDAGRDAWEEWYDLGKYLEQMRIERADDKAEIERLTTKIGSLTIKLDDARQQTRLAEETIGEAADLLADDIVEDDVAIDALVLDAIKLVLSQREDARALAVRLENEIAQPAFDLGRLKARLEAVEQERDSWGGQAATSAAEAAAFRRQRDEVLEALGNLHAAVVQVTNADPTRYEVANTVGQPALVAMQLVERYRRAAALSDSKVSPK